MNERIYYFDMAGERIAPADKILKTLADLAQSLRQNSMTVITETTSVVAFFSPVSSGYYTRMEARWTRP